MQDKLQGVEGRTAGTERRAGMRVRAPSLRYVDLGNSNGGIATWINENGRALTSPVTLDGCGHAGDRLRLGVHITSLKGRYECSRLSYCNHACVSYAGSC